MYETLGEDSSSEIPGRGSTVLNPPPVRQVWASNLNVEFMLFREVLENYRYVAVVISHAGLLSGKPSGLEVGSDEYLYRYVYTNVNRQQLVQVGMTLMDEKGKVPEDGVCTWQFNFKFDIAGFDFGYLLRTVTNIALPESIEEYFSKLTTYFPNVYDLKYIHLYHKMDFLKDDVEKIAGRLRIQRIEQDYHQTGSNSIVVAYAFFTLCKFFVFDEADRIMMKNKIIAWD